MSELVPSILRRNSPLLKTLMLALLCIPASLAAQLNDDFSDGNFTDNPAWQGDVANFTVNAAGELQLNAPDAGASVLSTPVIVPASVVMQLRLRLEFAPSTSNLLRVYLYARQPELLNGEAFYLELGENGNADALRLFHQLDNGTRVLLGSGTAGLAGTDPVDLSLHIERDAKGHAVISAAAGGGALQQEIDFTGNICTDTGPYYFGFYCLYSATRKDKFFFDNIAIGQKADTEAPQLLSAELEDATHLLLRFNEPLNELSAEDVARYTLSGGLTVVLAEKLPECGYVRLTLNQPPPTGTYTLSIQDVLDLQNNASGTLSAQFDYLLLENAALHDIIFNEIMAAPSAAGTPPNVEWVELFNRSQKYIDLQTLLLSDAGATKSIPAFVLKPDAFVLLSTTAGAAELAALGLPALGISGFPALNNDFDDLRLSDAAGQIIDRVVYADDWHTANPSTGRSLERINPFLPCGGGENWTSGPLNGTPGVVNAGFDLAGDVAPPELASVSIIDATHLAVSFSENLDPQAILDPAQYRITPDVQVLSAELPNDNLRDVVLELEQALEAGVLYALSAGDNLADCSGNKASPLDSLYFIETIAPETLDIVINEILFNPPTYGVDYVELYNRSDKIFRWSDFAFSNRINRSDTLDITPPRLFFPGEYAVFTEKPDSIFTRYNHIFTEKVYKTDLPTLDDDEGNLTLLWTADGQQYRTIDSLDYNADWHNGLLGTSDRDGVALERLDAEAATNNPFNWTSASAILTGAPGTPTLPNSQMSAPADPGSADELISLPLARLSPDGDGFEDFLEIHFQTPNPGFSATFTIFDAAGIPVRHLVRQELIGTEGILRWDGEADDRAPLRPGIYILFLEMFDINGTVKRTKKTFALVKKME